MKSDLDAGTEPGAVYRERQVLIVEDDEELSRLLGHWVGEHFADGASISFARTVQEATERIGELGRLDVVLLDRRLPRGTGDELLSTITAAFDPIVLMITGVEPSEGLLRLPITDYLVKPVDEAVLIKRLALLEKLDAAGVLSPYTDARKAALLEYHLEDPASSALFRRFASRWDYDRLEVAIDDAESYVYELYLGDDGSDVSISVIGRLAEPPADLVERDAITQVGDVIPSDGRHVWIDAAPGPGLSIPSNGYAVCTFDHDMPESFVESATGDEEQSVVTALETAYR